MNEPASRSQLQEALANADQAADETRSLEERAVRAEARATVAESERAAAVQEAVAAREGAATAEAQLAELSSAAAAAGKPDGARSGAGGATLHTSGGGEPLAAVCGVGLLAGGGGFVFGGARAAGGPAAAAALGSEVTALRTALRGQSEKAEAELARELRAFEQKVGAAVAAAEALAEVRMQAARDAFGSLEADLLERERGAIAAAALEVEARRAAEQLREAAETQLTAARREAALAAAEAAKAAEALRTERSTRAKAQDSITEMQRMTRDATRAAERAVLAESGLREEAAGLRRRLAEAMAALAAAKRAQPPPS